MRSLLVLLLSLLCLSLWVPPAAAQLKACQCLECLKLRQLSAKAEQKAYEDRWKKYAEKELQKSIDKYNNDAAYRADFEARGQVLFCDLLSTLGDELGVVREIEIPDIQKKIFAKKTKCMPKGIAGGTTSLLTCETDEAQLGLDSMNEPCDELHLAVVAHEFTHIEDCEWNRNKPEWLNQPGDSCNDAFRGKPTPTTEQFMEYAHFAFATEWHASHVEQQVEKLLANELTLKCKPKDYSWDMWNRFPEARKYLKRAWEYEEQFQ